MLAQGGASDFLVASLGESHHPGDALHQNRVDIGTNSNPRSGKLRDSGMPHMWRWRCHHYCREQWQTAVKVMMTKLAAPLQQVLELQ